jgi:general secretion pathway protein L
MSPTLVIRLSADAALADWVCLDDQGRQATPVQRGDLASIAATGKDQRVIVLVPAVHVITTDATLPPTKSAARLRQMLPYTLEETLAQDVEQLFFAVGPRRSGDRIAVAVVAQERMSAWLDRMRDAGLSPAAMYAESEAVPDTPGALTLVAENERIMGRLAGQSPFVFDGIELTQLLQMLGATAESDPAALPRHILFYGDKLAYARHEPHFAGIRSLVASFEARLVDDTALPHLAIGILANPGTNLLQGPYAPRSNWAIALRPWRLVASLVLALALVGIAVQAANYRALLSAEQNLSENIATTCRESFAIPQLAACRREAERRLSAVGASHVSSAQGFLPTLAAIAQNRDPNTGITALSYRNGVMDLRLVAPSVPVLDEFVQRMSERSNIEVRIQSANPGDSGIESQLQILGRTP